MAVYKCNACGGTFTDPQGAFRYFHVCPPLSVNELIALHDAGQSTGDPLLDADILMAKGPKSADPLQPSQADQAAARLAVAGVKRAGHVNTNVTPAPPRAKDDPQPGPLSAGAGVTQIGA